MQIYQIYSEFVNFVHLKEILPIFHQMDKCFFVFFNLWLPILIISIHKAWKETKTK